jgi:N-terminal domain of unknown function (DUF4140)
MTACFAEVARFLALDALAPGEYDVIVDGLTQFVNPDSLRVTGVGHVTMLQVSYDEVWVEPTPAPSTSVSETRVAASAASERLTAVTARIEAITADLEQILKQSSLYAQFAKKIVSPEGRVAPPRDLAYIAELIEKQEQTLRGLSTRKLTLQAEREELVAEAVVLRKTIAAASSSALPKLSKTRRVIVSIRVDALSPVELRVYYLTSNASWQSSYGMSCK